MGFFKYSLLDFLFTCLGLLVLLLDIVLDIFAVVTFYQEKAYVCLGLLLTFLLGSSFLVQAYSWAWYSDKREMRETTIGKRLSLEKLKWLHIFQLGIYIRHCDVFEMSLRSFFSNQSDYPADLAVYLSHDLSMLRFFETFTESCPQLVLMATIMLQRGQLDLVTVLKAFGSAAAITFSVTMYHRSMRSFLQEKQQQTMLSSAVYFAWNMLLISSRLAALTLFFAVLPCFIFAHLFCSWLLLFFFVWQSKTDFMESPCGERLYQATVGIIWYFNWFNVVEGKTMFRSLVYHGAVLADLCLLCSLWCWKMTTTEHPYFEISRLHAIITAVVVVVVYVVGLLLKLLYYRYFHPNVTLIEEMDNVTKEELIEEMDDDSRGDNIDGTLPITAMFRVGRIETDSDSVHRPKYCNKRMRKLAENFYFRPASQGQADMEVRRT